MTPAQTLMRLMASKIKTLAPTERPNVDSVSYGRPRFGQKILKGNRIYVYEIGQDDYGPPVTMQAGRARGIAASCQTGVEILIEGKSDRAGATEADHKDIVRSLANVVVACMVSLGTDWTDGTSGERLSIAGNRFTGFFAEVPEGELEAGARYALTCQIESAVPRLHTIVSADADLESGGTTTVTQTNADGTTTSQTVCGGA